MATPSPTGQKVDPRVLNGAQRQAVLSQAVEMTQAIYQQQVTPANGLQINIVPRNVGLIKRFIIIVEGVLQETGGVADGVLSAFGLQNLFQQVSFTDLNNNIRVQTAGWHLANLNTARFRWPFASAFQQSARQSGAGPALLSASGAYGNNFPVVVSPLTVPKGNSVAFRAILEVPLAYSDDDLRGAIYANVVNAVMQLGLTLNNNPFVAPGADNTFAIAEGGTLSFLGNLNLTVYQVYLDQLPIGKNGVVLPILDLSTVYEIKNTNFTAISPNQDFPIPYANFRDFLSTFAVFNSTGLDTNPGNGSDVQYWALQSANFTNLFKLDPLTVQMITRQIIQTDFPKAMYYFSHRRKPISTTQYGNMELVLNASAAAAGAYVNIGWEDFALVNTLTQAGSLAG